MTDALTAQSKIQQAVNQYETPKDSFKAEANWKGNEAWAKEQNDYEAMVTSFLGWILQRRRTTELIKPYISRGQPKKVDNVVHLLSDYGFTHKQWHRRDKELAVALEEINGYIDECIEMSKQPTLHGLLKFAIQIIGDSTGNEWWTPEEYIISVKGVLGNIDLDPASCEEANKIIQADTIYTEEINGLEKPWYGKVFMNPPYSINKPFAQKMCECWDDGKVDEAIILLGAHAIETKWFSWYWDHTLCFTGHRISFDTPSGKKKAGNIAGSVFIYLGNDPHEFADEFEQHGYIVRRWPDA